MLYILYKTQCFHWGSPLPFYQLNSKRCFRFRGCQERALEMVVRFVCLCVYISDKINNETLILFYLQKGLITNEQKPVINYHFNVIPPQCGCFHYCLLLAYWLLTVGAGVGVVVTVSLLLMFLFSRHVVGVGRTIISISKLQAVRLNQSLNYGWTAKWPDELVYFGYTPTSIYTYHTARRPITSIPFDKTPNWCWKTISISFIAIVITFLFGLGRLLKINSFYSYKNESLFLGPFSFFYYSSIAARAAISEGDYNTMSIRAGHCTGTKPIHYNVSES